MIIEITDSGKYYFVTYKDKEAVFEYNTPLSQVVEAIKKFENG